MKNHGGDIAYRLGGITSQFKAVMASLSLTVPVGRHSGPYWVLAFLFACGAPKILNGATAPDIRLEPLNLNFNFDPGSLAPAGSPTPKFSPGSAGMTASPHSFRHVQPDGTPIELYLRGGVDFHWLEDPSLYTVVQDGDKFVYAQLTADGRLAPTTLLVGKADPASAGLTPRILPSQVAVQAMIAERVAGAPVPAPPTPVPPVGTVKNVVILMRFANHTNRTLPPNGTYNTIMNAVGGDPAVAPTGSVRDFYLENSYGVMVLNSTVFGWVTLPQTEQYYADGQAGLTFKIQQAITDALNLADSLINFSQFDTDGNGFVDSIAFIHSGYGAEWGGFDSSGVFYPNRIWSHRWQIPDWTSAEGVRVRDYHINTGLWNLSGASPTHIGVICHETGHFFGLPDLYDTDGAGEGIGSYCLMANAWGFTGSQLNPPHASAWSKIFLNWTTPTIINTPGTYSLPFAETNAVAMKITNGYPSGEYLLVENRQPFGFDSTMPQGGLAIWHIDENKFDNTSQGYPGQTGWPGNNNHYRVALLQADGLFDLEHGFDRGDGGDVYHGAGVSAIGPGTSPSSDGYQNGLVRNTGNRIYDISTAGPTMSFKFASDPATGGGFDVINDGTASLTVTAITPEVSAPWITCTPAGPFSVPAGGVRFVTVAVNPALAPPGTTSTRLLVQSNDPNENPYPGGVFVHVTNNAVLPPILLSLSKTNATPRLTWNTVPGWTYTLEVSQDLTQWTTLATTSALFNAVSLEDVLANGFDQRFYQVRAALGSGIPANSSPLPTVAIQREPTLTTSPNK